MSEQIKPIEPKEGSVLSFNADTLRRYFNGPWYPVTVAVLVVLGHISGFEFVLNIFNVLLVSLGLVVCYTARPFIMFACSLLFQVSRSHAPGYFSDFSDYYYSGWRLPVLIVLCVILASAVAYFFVKRRLYRELSFKLPLLLPLLGFGAALILNGAFSSGRGASDLLLGFLQAVFYIGLFLFLYLGLKRERAGELCSYFTYVSAVIAVILIIEVAYLFLSTDVMADGSINKDLVVFGWGIWNTGGVCLTVLIPVCFLGVMKSGMPWVYFAIATLTLICAVATMSRNALLFGGLAYCVCLALCCFFGKHKRAFRIVALVGVIGAAVVAAVLWDKIVVLFGDFFERGFDLNGRDELWSAGINSFLSSPVFGGGFGALGESDSVALFPQMAHQTFIQLLSAMGIVGLLAYLCYRVFSLIPLFSRPSIEKTMLYISVLVMLGESLLDNFIFYFLPVIHYTVSLVIIFLLDGQRSGAEEDTAKTEDAQ